MPSSTLPFGGSPPDCSPRGSAAGDRLLVRLPNDSDYALVFLGAISAGLVPIPVSTQLTESEAAFLLADSRGARDRADRTAGARGESTGRAASCSTKRRSRG